MIPKTGRPSIGSRNCLAFWCVIGIDASIAASDGIWDSGASPLSAVGECIWARNSIWDGTPLIFVRRTSYSSVLATKQLVAMVRSSLCAEKAQRKLQAHAVYTRPK